MTSPIGGHQRWYVYLWSHPDFLGPGFHRDWESEVAMMHLSWSTDFDSWRIRVNGVNLISLSLVKSM